MCREVSEDSDSSEDDGDSADNEQSDDEEPDDNSESESEPSGIGSEGRLGEKREDAAEPVEEPAAAPVARAVRQSTLVDLMGKLHTTSMTAFPHTGLVLLGLQDRLGLGREGGDGGLLSGSEEEEPSDGIDLMEMSRQDESDDADADEYDGELEANLLVCVGCVECVEKYHQLITSAGRCTRQTCSRRPCGGKAQGVA